MNVLKAVIFSMSVAVMRTTYYDAEFKMSFICDSSAVARSFGYHGNVSSDIVCGMHCMRHSGCVSFSFDAGNSTCMLNDGLVMDDEVCEKNFRYGVKLNKSVCTQSIANVRLCNGSGNGAADSRKGRVEVFYNGQWGSVCDDGWEAHNYGYPNAKVVCKMFGFMNGVASISAAFGKSSGPIFLDTVICHGNESSIIDCSHDDVGSNDCSHSEDVGVACL